MRSKIESTVYPEFSSKKLYSLHHRPSQSVLHRVLGFHQHVRRLQIMQQAEIESSRQFLRSGLQKIHYRYRPALSAHTLWKATIATMLRKEALDSSPPLPQLPFREPPSFTRPASCERCALPTFSDPLPALVPPPSSPVLVRHPFLRPPRPPPSWGPGLLPALSARLPEGGRAQPG